MESVIAAIVAYVGGAALLIAFAIARGGNERPASVGTGVMWITLSVGLIVFVLGTCFVLGAQYIYRRTAIARGAIAVSCVRRSTVAQVASCAAALRASGPFHATIDNSGDQFARLGIDVGETKNEPEALRPTEGAIVTRNFSATMA